jgi:hypothetical protein
MKFRARCIENVAQQRSERDERQTDTGIDWMTLALKAEDGLIWLRLPARDGVRHNGVIPARSVSATAPPSE